MTFLQAWDRKTLRETLGAGNFTPFLGAGASSLRSRTEASFDDPPWSSVGKTLERIYLRVGSQESRRFLRAFAHQRLRMSDSQVERFMPKQAGTTATATGGAADLLDLQVALVRALRRLTAIFGVEFGKQVPSLRELPDCAVKFSLDDKDKENVDAWQRLCDAATIAKALKQRSESGRIKGPDPAWLPDTMRRGFPIKSVYESLVILTSLLVGQEQETKVRARFADRFKDNADLGALADSYFKAGTPRGVLRLDTMQWLGDLLEYSLVYWIPRFPTTAELAFELGLAVSLSLPRRPELAQAAQALDPQGSQNVQAQLAELMAYAEAGMKDPRSGYRRFYLSIAAVLCDQWAHYEEVTFDQPTFESNEFEEFQELEAGRSAVAVEKPPHASGRAAFLPVVASTNFDNGLESVFEELKIPYHVIFPIHLASKPPDNASRPWVFRTVSRRGETSDVRMWSSATELPIDKPRGPIIVKLHGKTFQPNRDPKGMRHRLVLSEQDYLDALQAGSAALKWFEKEMFERLSEETTVEGPARARSVWFLGYSIADWNVRLRLYSHLRAGQQGTLRAVNRDYDPFRQNILEALNVQLCLGDLNSVPDVIQRYYESMPCSGDVKAVVDALCGRS